MATYDEVEHKKTPKVDFRETKRPQGLELEARDLMLKAGTLMKSPLHSISGVAAVFFYEGVAGKSFEYKTFVKLGAVREDLAQAGVKEFNRSILKTFGVKVPEGRS